MYALLIRLGLAKNTKEAGRIMIGVSLLLIVSALVLVSISLHPKTVAPEERARLENNMPKSAEATISQ